MYPIALEEESSNDFRLTNNLVGSKLLDENGNVKMFQCNRCPFQSIHGANFYRHRKVVHENDRKYDCDLLLNSIPRTKFSSLPSKLKSHVEKVHDNVRVYKDYTKPDETGQFRCRQCPFVTLHQGSRQKILQGVIFEKCGIILKNVVIFPMIF